MVVEIATISTGFSAKQLDCMQERLNNVTPIQSQQEYRMMTIIMIRHMSENGGTVFLGTHLRVQRQVQRSRSSSFKIHIWTCRQSRPLNLNFLICYWCYCRFVNDWVWACKGYWHPWDDSPLRGSTVPTTSRRALALPFHVYWASQQIIQSRRPAAAMAQLMHLANPCRGGIGSWCQRKGYTLW